MVHSRDPVRVRAERRLNLYTRIIYVPTYNIIYVSVCVCVCGYAEKPIGMARRVYIKCITIWANARKRRKTT